MAAEHGTVRIQAQTMRLAGAPSAARLRHVGLASFAAIRYEAWHMGKHDRRNSAKMKRKKSQAKKKARDKRKRQAPKAGAATAKKTSRKASSAPAATS